MFQLELLEIKFIFMDFIDVCTTANPSQTELSQKLSNTALWTISTNDKLIIFFFIFPRK